MSVEENIKDDVKRNLKHLRTEDIINSKKIDDLIENKSDEDLSYIEEHVIVDKSTESELHKGNSKIQVRTYFDTKDMDLLTHKDWIMPPNVHVETHYLKDMFDKELQHLPKNVDQNVDA